MRNLDVIHHLRELVNDNMGVISRKLETTPEHITISTTVRDSPYYVGGALRLDKDANRVYTGEFNLLATNRQVAVFHSGACYARKRGLGQFMLELRLRAAKRAGVISVITTVREDNAVMQHILVKQGWIVAIPHQTPTVDLWMKRLEEM